jgi:hypothetical protein
MASDADAVSRARVRRLAGSGAALVKGYVIDRCKLTLPVCLLLVAMSQEGEKCESSSA